MPSPCNPRQNSDLALSPRVLFVASHSIQLAQALSYSLAQDRTVELHLPEPRDLFYSDSRLRACREIETKILASARCLIFAVDATSRSLTELITDFSRFPCKLVYVYSQPDGNASPPSDVVPRESIFEEVASLVESHGQRMTVVSAEELKSDESIFEMLCIRLGLKPVNNLFESKGARECPAVPCSHPLDRMRLAPCTPKPSWKHDGRPWELRVAPAAKARMLKNDEEKSALVEIELLPDGDKPGALSLVSQEMEIVQGEHYAVECTIQVDNERPIGLGIRRSSPSTQDDFYQRFSLVPARHAYLRAFQATESGPRRIILDLGNSQVPVEVAETTFRTSTKPIPLPLGRNETSVLIVDTSEATDSLRFVVHGKAADKGDAQVMFRVPPVAMGQRYRIRFEAKADHFKTIGFGVSRMVDPWLGLGIYFDVGLERFWKPYHYEFVANADCDKPRILFDLGLKPVSVDLRNLRLEPIVAELTDEQTRLVKEIILASPHKKGFTRDRISPKSPQDNHDRSPALWRQCQSIVAKCWSALRSV